MSWDSARVADSVGSCPNSQRKRSRLPPARHGSFRADMAILSTARCVPKTHCGQTKVWLDQGSHAFRRDIRWVTVGRRAVRCLICRECCGSGYTRPGHGCETSVVRELEPRTILQHGPSDQSWPARFAGNPQPPDSVISGEMAR